MLGGSVNMRVLHLAVVLVGLSVVALLCGGAQAANIPYSLSIFPIAGGYLFEGSQHFNRSVFGISI